MADEICLAKSSVYPMKTRYKAMAKMIRDVFRKKTNETRTLSKRQVHVPVPPIYVQEEPLGYSVDAVDDAFPHQWYEGPHCICPITDINILRHEISH